MRWRCDRKHLDHLLKNYWQDLWGMKFIYLMFLCFGRRSWNGVLGKISNLLIIFSLRCSSPLWICMELLSLLSRCQSGDLSSTLMVLVCVLQRKDFGWQLDDRKISLDRKIKPGCRGKRQNYRVREDGWDYSEGEIERMSEQWDLNYSIADIKE